MNTRPSATAGPEKPFLMAVRQRTGSPPGGSVSTIPVSFQTPRSPLPRYRGQSSACRATVRANPDANTRPTTHTAGRTYLFIMSLHRPPPTGVKIALDGKS